MENKTYLKDFCLMSFFANSNYISLTISVFFPLYLFGVFINFIIIAVIYFDDQLHTPMYLFLCNLALVDICYTTTTVPKLLHMLLTQDNIVSFKECITQIYCYFLAGSTEDILIFIMAYDRYVAICDPLHYHYILHRKNCLLITAGTWISGSLNSIVITIPVTDMSFCQSHIIHQFFCDVKALLHISCTGIEEFYIVIYMEILIFGFIPIIFSVTSYIKIFSVLSHIHSNEGKKKAFSTCSSHLLITIMYYFTSMFAYVMPPSENSKVLEPVFATLYSVVTPMINPLIYSLRNKDVKRALLRLLGLKASLL